MQEKSLLDYVSDQSYKPRPPGFVPLSQRILEEMADVPIEKECDLPSPESRPKPIWEIIKERADALPDELVAKLPTDGAEQHDHYLYGWPKKIVK